MPSPLKALVILAYMVGMTRLLNRGFSTEPNVVTAQLNLPGAVLLEGFDRLARRGADAPGT